MSDTDTAAAEPAPAPPPEVFLAFPSYNKLCRLDVYQSVFSQCCKSRNIRFGTGKCSLLAFGFNSLLTNALNAGCKWFVMVHSDVQPAPLWLDTLLDEAEATQADVLSAVLPIKSDEGLTSTAIDDPHNDWEPWCRLSMREVMRLPLTFDAEDAGFPGRGLLLNTGLMAVRLGPWVEEFPGFTIKDRIVKRNGQWVAEVQPEDWNFSRWCNARGMRLLASRKIQAHHWGEEECYPNYSEWGTLERDGGCGRSRAEGVSAPVSEKNGDGMRLEGAELIGSAN